MILVDFVIYTVATVHILIVSWSIIHYTINITNNDLYTFKNGRKECV